MYTCVRAPALNCFVVRMLARMWGWASWCVFCVYVYVCVCVYMHASVHACVHVCQSVYACVRACVYVSLCVRACVRVCVHACVHVCACVPAPSELVKCPLAPGTDSSTASPPTSLHLTPDKLLLPPYSAKVKLRPTSAHNLTPHPHTLTPSHPHTLVRKLS